MSYPGRGRKVRPGRGQRLDDEDEPPGLPSRKRDRSASSLSLGHTVQKAKSDIRECDGTEQIRNNLLFVLEEGLERKRTPDPVPYKENEDYVPFDLDKLIPQRYDNLEESYTGTGWVPYHKILGEGQYGKVFLGFRLSDQENEHHDRHMCAFKIVPCQMSYAIHAEVICLRSLVHEYIIDLFDEFICLYDNEESAFIIMEYADAGSLADECYEHDGDRLPESTARCYFKQVTSAIAYMHGKGISHCDLHVNNILMRYEYDGKKKCLIADFGSSEICWIRDSESDGKSPTSPQYSESHQVSTHVTIVAPDVARVICNGSTYAITGWKKLSSDIWSLGCLLHYMLAGEYPLGHLFNDAVLDKDALNQESCDFLNKILIPEEKDRICIKEIINDDWMKGDVSIVSTEEDNLADTTTGRTRRSSLNWY